MIDRKQIDAHPVSRLALTVLRELGATPTMATPLLQLTFWYLDSLEPSGTGVTEELAEEAARLMNGPAAEGIALLVGDYEELQRELEETTPENQWPVLAEHLDMLERAMDDQPSPSEKAHVLAENLLNSLEHLSPGFARA